MPKIRRRRGLNEYIIDGDICRIKVYGLHWIYKGEVLIDLCDMAKAQELKWHIKFRRGKPVSVLGKQEKTNTHMHRFLFGGPPEGLERDHINRNPLDNRRGNLRFVTPLENQWNQGMRSTNTSGYKGVIWSKQRRKWMANIEIGRRKIYLGFHHIPEEAALAYNRAARAIRGDFAVLNPVEGN